MITKRKLDKKIEGLSEFASSHLTGLQKQVDDLREEHNHLEGSVDAHSEVMVTQRDVIRALIILGGYSGDELLKAVKLAEQERKEWKEWKQIKEEKFTELEKEADLFTAAEEKKEQGAVHNNMRKYYRDKKRPQVRSWARRFNIPVKIFRYGMKMCDIEGVAVTPRDTTEMQYKRLTEQEANEVFRFLCRKVGELK